MKGSSGGRELRRLLQSDFTKCQMECQMFKPTAQVKSSAVGAALARFHLQESRRWWITPANKVSRMKREEETVDDAGAGRVRRV